MKPKSIFRTTKSGAHSLRQNGSTTWFGGGRNPGWRGPRVKTIRGRKQRSKSLHAKAEVFIKKARKESRSLLRYLPSVCMVPSCDVSAEFECQASSALMLCERHAKQHDHRTRSRRGVGLSQIIPNRAR